MPTPGTLAALPWARMLRQWCLGLWLAGAGCAMASSDVPEAYVLAARQHGVPPEVLYAVSLNESKIQLDHGLRPWPWTLNVAGKGYHFETRDAACEALSRALFQTQVVDVGIAQINFRWQPQLFGAGNRFVDPCDALDPYANLEEAANLLRGHYEASGRRSWLVAAGRYHRPAGGAPAARYRRAVAAHLERLSSGTRSSSTAKAVAFASVEDVPTSVLASSHPVPSPEPARPITADRSLIWVAPTEPVAWVDPERRWDRLVAAQ